MSFIIHQSSIPPNIQDSIPKDLLIQPSSAKSKFMGFAQPRQDPIIAFEQTQDHFLLPFAWSISTLNTPLKPRDQCKTIDLRFTGTLRDIQNEVKPEVVSTLNATGSVILSLYPGAGKTAFTIYLSTKIRLQTLIIAHRVILINQFKETIERFVPNAKVQILKPGKDIDPSADYYIINAINMEKFGFVFPHVGLVIVDEVHCIATKSLIKSLLYVTPRYLIGLSATPQRPDGLDKLLDIYFGTHKVTRNLQRVHTYIQLHTHMIPDPIEYNMDGTINWNSVLTWQSDNEDRNRLIVDIAMHHMDRNWLILCKRKSQGETLLDMFKERGEDPTYLMADKNDFDVTSRIVVVTVQKCGVGFSHDKLDGLIIASDVEEYFIQYLGRVFRTEHGEPLVYDLIDNFKSLERHAATRKKVSKEAKGKITKKTIDNWSD